MRNEQAGQFFGEGCLIGHTKRVMTATAANQVAQGFAAQGHGLFTKILLDGLAGNADRARDEEIDTIEAATYVRAEVPKLLPQQTPMTYPVDLFGLTGTPLTRYQLAAPIAGK